MALIIGFAANYEFQSLQANASEGEAINVETFNMQPDTPEPSAEETFTPPPAEEPPMPVDDPVNQEPDRPISTPMPTAIPVPTPTPTPQGPTEPIAPKPTPTPTPAPSEPGPSPTPSASPSPTDDLPPQFANLPESEQTAGKFLKDYLKSQNLELPETLPFGFKNWDEYAKFINNDYEEQAYKLGQLPGNTRGVEEPTDGNTSSPNPESSTTPESTNPRTGKRFGNFGDRELNQGEQRIEAQKKKGLFDYFKRAPQIKTDRELDIDLFNQNDPFKDPNKNLDDASKRLKNLDLDLGIPSPSPIPLPDDYNLGDLGVILYVNFNYDNMSFKAQWEKEQSQNSTIAAQFYPPSDPSQLQNLKLQWREEWGENPKALIRAIIRAYEDQKNKS